eukprot:s2002_g2.t1
MNKTSDIFLNPESIWVWWFGFAEGLLFLITIVHLNFDTGAMVFSIKLFSGYWMHFLKIDQEGFRTPWTPGFSIYKNKGIQDLTNVVLGAFLTILIFLFPYPLTALQGAQEAATVMSHEVPYILRLFVKYLEDTKSNDYEQDRIMRNIRRLQRKGDSLSSNVEYSWWECFGWGSRQADRVALRRLETVLRDCYDSIHGIWSVSELRKGEERGKHHLAMIEVIRVRYLPLLNLVEELIEQVVFVGNITQFSDAQAKEVLRLIQEIRTEQAVFREAKSPRPYFQLQSLDPEKMIYGASKAKPASKPPASPAPKGKAPSLSKTTGSPVASTTGEADAFGSLKGVLEALSGHYARVAQTSLEDALATPWQWTPSLGEVRAVLLKSGSTNIPIDVRPAFQKAAIKDRMSYDKDTIVSCINDCKDVSPRLLESFSLMQVSMPQGPRLHRECKTSPHTDEQDDLMQAFRDGHAQPQQHLESSEEADMSQNSEGYDPSIASEEVGPGPPSDEEGRQDVYLYHLADPPIRAMLIWTDYQLMIDEIGRHFQVQQGMVVDAFEISVPLPDLPEGAAAAVVQLLPDLPVGPPMCLPIFDIETHGHRIERHFKTGPAVERFVLPTPRRISRHGLLVLLNLDQYCEFEGGRCIVYLNQIRWPDTDLGLREISSGDYLRVAVPPSEHYACETANMIEFLQAGLSHDEILSHLHLEGVQEGFSPEMLDDNEIRELRTPNLVGEANVEDDALQAMQVSMYVQNSVEKEPTAGLDMPPSPHEAECTVFQFRASAREFRPGEQEHHQMDETTQILHVHWHSMAFAWEQEAPAAHFLVWYLAPGNDRRQCLYGRRVALSEDFWNWSNYLKAVWMNELLPVVDCDVVPVDPRPTHLEPGIAGHVLLIQMPQMETACVLISVFDHAINAGHPFKQAHVIPERAQAHDIIRAVGYEWDCAQMARCVVVLRGHTLRPDEIVLSTDGDAFDVLITRHVLPVQWVAPFRPQRPGTEGLNLLQTDVALMPKRLGREIEESLTDEFLRAVRAAEAVNDQIPTVVEPDTIEAQTEFVQELWEYWQDQTTRSEDFREPTVRVETWFVDHILNDRCYHPRIVVLSSDFRSWEASLIAAWSDRAVIGQETSFALVYPTPEDMASGAIIQVVMVQHVSAERRSIVLSVYDTDPEVDPIRTFCITLDGQISLDVLLEILRLADDCPPRAGANECFLWFGTIPIHAHRVIHLRTGNALRLVVRRGLPIDIPTLLAMPDNRLRAELQNAIGGHVFRRPDGPAFMRNVSASSAALPVQVDNLRVQVDTRGSSWNDAQPSWLVSLQTIFQNNALVEAQEEGPVMYVLVWFLHGTSLQRCSEPRVVRLQGLPFEWRTELVFAWRDSLRRGEPIDFHIVHPDPPKAQWQSHVAHVLMTQDIVPGQAAVLLSAVIQETSEAFMDHVACLLPSNVPLLDLHTAIVPRVFRQRPTRARRGSQILPVGFEVTLQTGESIVFEILAGGNQDENDLDSSGVSLLQRHAQLHQTSEASLNHEAPTMTSVPDTRIDLHPAISTFEWLDSHFTLVSFVCPEPICLHPASQAWLELPIWDFTQEAHEMRVYFDGSFLPSSKTSGMAFDVFICSFGRWYNAGFLSATLPDADSYTAELYAAIATVKVTYDFLKILATVQVAAPEVWIGYDSLTVGNQLFGRWKCRQHPVLGKCLRMLTELCETRFQCHCQGWHIPSHRGEPGNELVDALANAAAAGFATHDLSHFFHVITQKDFVMAGEWMWILFATEYADKWDSHHIVLPGKPTTVPDLVLVPEQTSKIPVDCAFRRGTVTLRLATANVLTLKGMTDNGCGPVSGPTRQTTLLQQFHEDGVCIFAMQETRLKRQHSAVDNRYLLFSSSATNSGHFGIIVGFSLKHAHGRFMDADGRSTDVFFRTEHFAILHSDPRVLLLRVRTPILKCIVIAAHAPHTGAGEQEIESWWQEVTSAIPGQYDKWDRLLLADANARIGTFPSQHVGTWQAEEDSPKSDYFLDFLQKQALWLPSTFEEYQQGEGGTWCHPSGKWLRNDYIGIPLAWQPCTLKAFVNENIDVSTVKEDHAVATVELMMDALVQPPEQRRYVVKRREFDLDALDESKLDAPFQVDWNVDVHTHADCLQNFLLTCIPAQRRMAKPLKQTMSPQTWTLVLEKRFWRNQLWEANSAASRLWLRVCFASWRRPMERIPEAELSGLVKQHDFLCATAYGRFRQLGRLVVQASRRDDVSFFTHLATQAGELLAPQQARGFWNVIRRSLPKMRARRQAPNPFQLEHLEEQWHPYFQELEVGSAVEPEQLLRECHDFQMHQIVDDSVCPLSVLPSRSQIADAFRDTQAHRATGLDPMPSGLFHRFPVQLAKLCMDLFVKIFLWQMEPIQGKGGILAVIPKKNDMSRASHFRGIMLLPSIFKRLHAILRTQLVSIIAPLKPAGQIGGFHGQQVQFGSMTLQCVSRIAKKRRLSMGVVFVDLANAFHRLIRELVCGIARNDDVDTLLSALSEPSSIGVQKWLEFPCLLQRLGAPSRLIRLLRDVHTHTWHVFAAHPGLTRTRRGTRPGSPLADIVFHVIMLDVTIELNTWMREQTALQDILRDLNIAVEAIVWSDDLAIPWLSVSADGLIPDIERMMQQIYKVFTRRGFDLNMQKGKTAAVLTFRGNGAPALRRKYQLVSPSGMMCQLAVDKSAWLHFCPSYKHLGTFLAVDGGFQTELASRIGQAKSAFSALAKPVLGNRHIPVHVRLRLFHALVGTKLFFGLGSWPSPAGKSLSTLNAFLVQCLRKILGLSHYDGSIHTTDAQVFAQARCLDARGRIAWDRLLLAQKLFQHGPAFVHHLLHREFEIGAGSWLHGVFADLAWLHQLDPVSVPFHWTQDLTEAIDHWQAGAVGWKALLRRLGKRHVQQEAMMAEVSAWHRKIFHVLTRAGGSFSPSPFAKQLDTNLADHQCFCGRAFTSAVGLATHQRKQHNMMSPEHEMLNGATCPACLRHFWSTQRLQQHLSYVSRRTGRNDCFQILKNAGYQADYARVCMPKDFVGLDRVNWVEVEGPRPLFPDQRVSAIVRCEEELAQIALDLKVQPLPDNADQMQKELFDDWTQQTSLWFESFSAQGFDAEMVHDLEDRWVATMCAVDAKFDLWLEWCFRKWGQDDLPEVISEFADGEAEHLVDEAFAELVAKLPSDASYGRQTFLRSRIQMLLEQDPVAPHRSVKLSAASRCRVPALQDVPMSYEQQATWHDQLRKVAWVTIPSDQPIPRLLRGQGCHFLIVHLFSGRRRFQDIHWWIANWAERRGVSVTILSMDTAVSMECGNLQVQATSWKKLTALYEAGVVSATLAGAPCETFSAARHLDPPEFAAHLRWPRPLRSAARLFGLPQLTMKELRQCQQGTAFSLQTLWTAAMHIAHGGLFLSEHPACPEDVDKASIWRSALVQLFLGLPDCSLHTVPQWRWGSATPKPTGLFSIRIPTLLRSLYACADPNIPYPTLVAQGVDEVGHFRTSRCKEYPSLFCRALATSITDRFDHAMRFGSLSDCTVSNTDLHQWAFFQQRSKCFESVKENEIASIIQELEVVHTVACHMMMVINGFVRYAEKTMEESNKASYLCDMEGFGFRDLFKGVTTIDNVRYSMRMIFSVLLGFFTGYSGSGMVTPGSPGNGKHVA